MQSHHGIEHQDVIRIIGSSKNSFDEAVQNGISTIKEGHGGTPRAHLDFVSFEVVQLQGTIEDDGKQPTVAVYQAVLDVVGVHRHEH
ncbi:MAG: dodecin domain-containing protein [Salibacteraceae bacterium]